MYPILKKENTSSFIDFVNYWQSFYNYKVHHPCGNNLYDDRIHKQQFNEEDIYKLFLWKNGRNLSKAKEKLVQQIAEDVNDINELKQKQFSEKDFLNKFQYMRNGIWKIFLLHIIAPNKYPIFDQHVYRAYMCLNHSRIQEINSLGNGIMEFYFEKYIPYIFDLGFRSFDDVRKVDKALFAFGRYLKGDYNIIIE